MKRTTLALTIAILITPTLGFAHGQAPAAAHGGQMQDAHGNWVELAVTGDRVAVYVTDKHGNPVPAAQVSGTATVLVGNEMHKVQLAPTQGNELIGRLPVAASGKTAATVSLKIGGKPATARFASAG